MSDILMFLDVQEDRLPLLRAPRFTSRENEGDASIIRLTFPSLTLVVGRIHGCDGVDEAQS